MSLSFVHFFYLIFLGAPLNCREGNHEGPSGDQYLARENPVQRHNLSLPKRAGSHGLSMLQSHGGNPSCWCGIDFKSKGSNNFVATRGHYHQPCWQVVYGKIWWWPLPWHHHECRGSQYRSTACIAMASINYSGQAHEKTSAGMLTVR